MVLNALHAEMAIQGFEEGHVHQENDVSNFVGPSIERTPTETPLWGSISCYTVYSPLHRRGTYSSHIQRSERGQKTADTVSETVTMSATRLTISPTQSIRSNFVPRG